jgi:type III pantothenate kinase
MRLLLDVGNSRTKWATADSAGLSAIGAFDPRDDAQREAMATALDSRPDRVVLASVGGGPVTDALSAWAAERFNTGIERIEVTRAFGEITTRYREPARLGVDRWLAVIAAWHHCRRACVVADVGTALTVDFLDAKAVHHGGMIVPGPGMMIDGLIARAPGIRVLQGDRDDEFPARDTGGAVNLGARLAAAAAIDRAVARWAASEASGSAPGPLPRSLPLLITGGHAEGIAPWLETGCERLPALVLEGMRLVSEE